MEPHLARKDGASLDPLEQDVIRTIISNGRNRHVPDLTESDHNAEFVVHSRWPSRVFPILLIGYIAAIIFVLGSMKHDEIRSSPDQAIEPVPTEVSF